MGANGDVYDFMFYPHYLDITEKLMFKNMLESITGSSFRLNHGCTLLNHIIIDVPIFGLCRLNLQRPVCVRMACPAQTMSKKRRNMKS
jgi:hypothetical protein